MIRDPKPDNLTATPKRPATLADVARKAGVVAMTASRAINRSGYVSVEVRERVLAAARQLKYRPNMQARYLKGQRLKAIGIMMPDIANPFGTELVAGMMEVLDNAGYAAFIGLAGRGVEQEKAGLQAFVDHRVDGLLVATRRTLTGDKTLKEFVEQRIPIVTVGRFVEGASVDCVTADYWQGAFDVVSHMIAQGHQRIAFVGISAADGHTLPRYKGYRAALEHAGLTLAPEYTVGRDSSPTHSTQEDGYEGMLRLMQLKKPPTAVFACNDVTAIGALSAIHTLGLSVPDDVSIAGFDDIPLAAYATPPLTTVRQPIAEQGRLAAEMLLDRIEGKLKGGPKLITKGCELVVRASTGSAARSA